MGYNPDVVIERNGKEKAMSGVKSKFVRGSGCFKCVNCGKKTREVNGNQSVELCPACWIEANMENHHSDNAHAGAVLKCAECKNSALGYFPDSGSVGIIGKLFGNVG